jgi:hypothetical protein
MTGMDNVWLFKVLPDKEGRMLSYTSAQEKDNRSEDNDYAITARAFFSPFSFATVMEFVDHVLVSLVFPVVACEKSRLSLYLRVTSLDTAPSLRARAPAHLEPQQEGYFPGPGGDLCAVPLRAVHA